MKLLKCKLCYGEVDIIDNHKSINKKIKCRKCGFCNKNFKEKKTDIVVIKNKLINN